MKKKIIVHQRAWLPHYLPLYWSLLDCDDVDASVQTYTNRKGLDMFKAANLDDVLEQDSTLHLILAGQLDTVFDTPEGRAIIAHFVSGTILIHRSPLWLYAASSTAFDALKAGQSVKIITPPEDSTLSKDAKIELSKIPLIAGSEHSFVNDDSVFLVSNAEGLTTLLAKHEAQVIASIFPIRPSGDLVRCNFRLPSDYTGFTSLWISKAAVYDDAFLGLFRKIHTRVHDYIHGLMALDRDILDKGDNRYQDIVAHIADAIRADTAGVSACRTGFSKLLSKPILRAALSKLGLRSDDAIHWDDNAAHIMAELAAARIWDYNFIFTRDPSLSDGEQNHFYPKSLPAFLHKHQLDHFRSKLAVQVKDLIVHYKTIQHVGQQLEFLKQLLEGSSDVDEIGASNGLAYLAKRWKTAFDGEVHRPDQASENKDLLLKQLTDAIACETAETKVGIVAVQSYISRLSSVTSDRISIIKLCNNEPATGEYDERIIYEAKAITKDSIALSWLGDSGPNTKPWKFRLNEAALAKDAQSPFNAISLLRILAGKDFASEQKLRYASGRWSFQLKVERASGSEKDLAGLGPYIYGKLGEAKPEGQTSRAVYALRAMGFKLRVESHTTENLTLAIDLQVTTNE